MGGIYTMDGEIRNAYNILVGKLNRQGPPGRPKCRWEGNSTAD
jgi:hypothetical protein